MASTIVEVYTFELVALLQLCLSVSGVRTHAAVCTHLLTRALVSFPGIGSSGVHLSYATAERFREVYIEPEASAPLGIDWSVRVDIEAVKQTLQQPHKGKFACGHVPYSEFSPVNVELFNTAAGELLIELGYESGAD